MNKEKDSLRGVQKETTSDPAYHVSNVRKMMHDLVKHMEQDEGRMDDPHALALFETSREVLKGLMAAMEHFEQKSEKAWKK